MSPRWAFVLLLLVTLSIQTLNVLAQGDQLPDIVAEHQSEGKETNPSEAKKANYVSPRLKFDSYYLFDAFDDEQTFRSNWIQSQDPKYEGHWKLDSGPDRPHADKQLLLPQKARHYAISAKLKEPFKFSSGQPLVVQYEVQFREGLDCGGAYVKLVRQTAAIDDLSKVTDKTPFTIMFGPDKCGSESKLHFIVQYLNPKTQEYQEKHWKQAKYASNLMAAFTDKQHHLFKLLLKPSNDFEIYLDDKSVGKGNLFEDLDPAINPPKEIVDLNDSKPADWDERPSIEDPQAKKPDDWDEDAPKTIEDPSATKPDDWLDNEPKYIPDPEAKKPEDWEEMDGEWEPPTIENPACSKVSGCGQWKAPMIPNPNYKGVWKPPKIDNPNYKGKWEPRMIPNPDYFYDENPFFSLDPIGALSFELWSMADNIAFDNLIVTSDPEAASLLQHLTWQDKKAQADASSPSLLTRSLHYLKLYPWLWVLVALAVALPLFVFITYCCDTKKSASARRKKTDESRPDDTVDSSEQEPVAADENEDEEQVDEEENDEKEESNQDEDDVLVKEKNSSDNVPVKRPNRQKKKKN